MATIIPEDRFVCGVPECPDGIVVEQDIRYTKVDCNTHNAFTSHATTAPVEGEQKVIRVQDSWRQHGTNPPRK